MRIFLSTPISCYKSREELSNYKKEIDSLLLNLKSNHSVCSEIESIDSLNDYDAPEKSISDDLQSVMECDVFILHYPQKISTSALIELGFAISFNKKIIIITPHINMLPYLALGVPSKCQGSLIIEANCISEEVIKKIQKNLK